MNIILFEEMPSFIAKGDERAYHILSVLRLKEGDVFKAGIINSNAMECTIEKIDESGIYLSSREKEDLSTLYPVTLMLAEVRPICMKRILRESSSLGIERIMLLISDLGEKSYKNSGLYANGEYKKILIDGAMQSGFTGVPRVDFYDSVDQALKDVNTDNRILLDNVIGSEDLSKMKLSGSLTLAIGPERGWSDRERGVILSSGFTPALIGKRILRTETATVAGITLSLAALAII